jgi:TPR repeat protein
MLNQLTYAGLLCLLLLTLPGRAQKTIKIVGGKAPTGTERRAAVLLANQNYALDKYDLTKCYNDLTDMAAALDKLGFEVVVQQTDLNRVTLYRTLQGLPAKLANYDVVVFFYSGHGAMHDGKNYLIPTDTPQLAYAADVATFGIDLDEVYKALRQASIRTSIVVSDACRSLPMGKGNLPTGWVIPKSNPSGTYTMFATSTGNLAHENDRGRNGFFTQELLRHLTTPNLTINQIFRATRKGVKQATNEQQEPDNSDKLDDDFVFVETARAIPIPPSSTQVIANVPADNYSNAQAVSDITEGVRAYDRDDYARAFSLLSRHQSRLDATNQTRLGYMLQNGAGVERNYSLAVYWYRKAAEQGNADGQNNLGVMYRDGLGVAQDYTQAISWCRKAADQGHAAGQYNLGHMYEKSLGVGRDYAQAIKWYRRAAEQGNPDGECSLGYMCEKGMGVEQDYTKAVIWYRKAAEQENADGQCNLGAMYRDGRGVVQDYAQATNWFRKAAEHGHTDGELNLGYMYENGWGVGQDYTQSINWYRRAVAKDNATGQYRLGYMYENSLGVEQSFDTAIEYYRRSAWQGNEQAREALIRLGRPTDLPPVSTTNRPVKM